MNVHPVVSQLNGVISVQLQAQFLGTEASPPDTSQDALDQSFILAFGDPKVNLAGAGEFTDNSTIPAFTFRFGTPMKMVGITTQMAEVTARFYTVIPPVPLERHTDHLNRLEEERLNHLPAVRPMDCITNDPERAAGVWVAAIQTACQAAMIQLRDMGALNPPPLTLPDRDI